MSKVQKIILCAATLLIVALLIVCGVTDGAKKTVNCPDCGAAGTVACGTCFSKEANACTGLIACTECEADAINPDCETCTGLGAIACTDCEGALILDC